MLPVCSGFASLYFRSMVNSMRGWEYRKNTHTKLQAGMSKLEHTEAIRKVMWVFFFPTGRCLSKNLYVKDNLDSNKNISGSRKGKVNTVHHLWMNISLVEFWTLESYIIPLGTQSNVYKMLSFSYLFIICSFIVHELY